MEWIKEKRKSQLENKNCCNDLPMKAEMNKVLRKKQGTCMPKYLPQNIIYKVINSNSIVEKPDRHHLNQRTKVNITSNKIYWHQVPPDDWYTEDTSLLHHPSPKCTTLNLIKKISDISKPRNILQNTRQVLFKSVKYSSKVSRSLQAKKDEEQLQIEEA